MASYAPRLFTTPGNLEHSSANQLMPSGIQRQQLRQFQSNSSVPFPNFPPPNVKCPPPAFQNRPPMPHFGDSGPLAVSERMHSPPFKFMVSNPPPSRQEVPRFTVPSNVNAPLFRPMIDRPPPCRPNFPMFSSAGETKHFNPRPDYLHPPRAADPRARFANHDGVPHMRPNLPSVHMNHRFSAPFARAPFEHRFPPRNRSPSFAGPSNLYEGPELPPKRKITEPFNREKKKFKERDGRKIKSWMTDELLAEVLTKNKLYSKAKASDDPALWQEFRLQRNRVSSMIKDAKIKAGILTRKVKEDNPDDKVAKPFSCDTCDRAFALQKDLSEHLAEHIKCNADGCNFEAHPKIVALHKKMQHDTGYAATINKLQSAEDIQKWRAERKRRFPTVENIQKKKAEQAEKEARGEVLETKEFGKFKRQNFERNNVRRGKFHHSGRRGRHYFNRNSYEGRSKRSFTDFPKTTLDSDSDSDSHIHLKKFAGMSSLLNDTTEDDKSALTNHLVEKNTSPDFEQEDVSKEDIIELSQNPSDSPQRKLIKECQSSLKYIHEKSPEVEIIDMEDQQEIHTTSIKALNSGFECDPIHIEDSDDEPPMAIPIIKEKSVEVIISNGSLNEDSQLSENVDAHDEQPQSLENMELKPKSYNVENSHKKVNNEKAHRRYETQYDDSRNQNRNNVYRKSSLLEKLLADEIRHERNVILQCVHYIVRKNYFGIGNQNIKSDILLS